MAAPAAGPGQAAQHPDGRGLARAVRAEKPKDRARIDGERETAHRLEIAKALAQIV